MLVATPTIDGQTVLELRDSRQRVSAGEKKLSTQAIEGGEAELIALLLRSGRRLGKIACLRVSRRECL